MKITTDKWQFNGTPAGANLLAVHWDGDALGIGGKRWVLAQVCNQYNDGLVHFIGYVGSRQEPQINTTDWDDALEWLRAEQSDNGQ